MRKITLIAAVLFFSVIGYYAISFFIPEYRYRIQKDLKYDKDAWENGTLRERGRMTNYLIDSMGIIGKTKNEVISIIGKPDSKKYTKGGTHESNIYYIVDLGYPLTYQMIIYFDSTDTARKIILAD